MEFDVLMKDTVMVHVHIEGTNVEVIHYMDTPLAPFQMDNVTIGIINRFFESRCFDESRPDKHILLDSLGLECYNPLEIVKKTHGFLLHDFIWVRFEGEDLTWEDVRYGRTTELSDR